MNCQRIIHEYTDWIKDNTKISAIKEGEACLISTPFLDKHNDNIELYIYKQDEKYTLTDDGHTLRDLKMSGVDINTSKREKIFKTALNGFGVAVDEMDRLYVQTSGLSGLPSKKHALLQAIIAVNDMYVLSQENVFSLFKEDVERFLERNAISHTRDIKISGKTGFDHTIDFLITSTKDKPERLIKTINSPRKDPVMSAIFAFNDITATRDRKADNIVFYNDSEAEASTDIIEAFNRYEIEPIAWSKREEKIETLV